MSQKLHVADYEMCLMICVEWAKDHFCLGLM